MRQKVVLRKKVCDATKGRETETKTLSLGNTDEFVLYLVMMKLKAGRRNKSITVDNADLQEEGISICVQMKAA